MKETAQMKKPPCVVESLKVTPIRWGINYHKHTRPQKKNTSIFLALETKSWTTWDRQSCVQKLGVYKFQAENLLNVTVGYFSMYTDSTAAAESLRRDEAIMETIQKHSVTQGDERDCISICNVSIIYAWTFVQQQFRIWFRLKWSDWMVWRAITLCKGSKILTHSSLSFAFSDHQRTTNPWSLTADSLMVQLKHTFGKHESSAHTTLWYKAVLHARYTVKSV